MGAMHAECYSQIPDARVVAIADKRADIAHQVADPVEATVYDDATTLIDEADVDIVDVCMPTPFHKEFVAKVAEAGKHVFCEKPLAPSIKDGEAMIVACEKAGVRFMVGHVLRYFLEYAAIKNKIDQGHIGRPAVVRASRCASQPVGWQDWYKKREMSGGVCLDLIIHDFDFLRWCFGEVERVFACGTMYGLISYDSRTASPVRISVKTQAEGKAAVELPESPVKNSPYLQEIKHFVECVSEDRQPEITGKDALEAIRIGLAALESIKTNKPVTL
jgi:predicted dehydrogenase